MLATDAEAEPPTVDWLLERGRAVVAQDGVTDLLIDPWNEIEQTRGEATETEFIGRSLQRLRQFQQSYGCNVWCIVHPKATWVKPGEKPVPGPHDLYGGSQWYNKTDLGITVHSPDPGHAELHVWKSKKARDWGQRGGIAKMEFDAAIGRYSDPLGGGS
jgi:twinkle protein